MTSELFEQLLHEDEGNALDFKSAQYKFINATEEEQAELLKDILAFANAWRRSTAYILIGVKEVRGGRCEVIGITDHIPDHSLQQFVSSKITPQIHFAYETLEFEGKQVGIVRIDEVAKRPVVLKRNVGKLAKDAVYVRRGSATVVAELAEAIEMSKSATTSQTADITVEFADLKKEESNGNEIAWVADWFCPPENIPDYQEPSITIGGHTIPTMQAMRSIGASLNKGYYRDLAMHKISHELFKPVRFCIRNNGSHPANRVRCEIDSPIDTGFIWAAWLPKKPKAFTSYQDKLGDPDARTVFDQTPGQVTIDRNDYRHRIEIDCKDIQPGRTIYSDLFFVCQKNSGDNPFVVKVFADNLPAPKDFTLTVKTSITQRPLSLKDIKAMVEK